MEPTPEIYDCVDGEVIEVLEAVGLAHVLIASGQICGLNRTTSGIEFSTLREGARVRCTVVRKFSRIVYAELIA